MLQKSAIEPYLWELLKKLQAENFLKDFYLVGGTALALQIGHRKSIDLDLFTQEYFDYQKILEQLETRYYFQADYTDAYTLKGSIQSIKVDFITHSYKLVKNPVYESEVALLSKEDIAAMKLNAIAGNGTRSKDFIDIYFLLNVYSLEDLLSFYQKKYSQRNILHVIKSLVYFEDMRTTDWPELLKEKDLTANKLKVTLQNHVKDYSQKLL